MEPPPLNTAVSPSRERDRQHTYPSPNTARPHPSQSIASLSQSQSQAQSLSASTSASSNPAAGASMPQMNMQTLLASHPSPMAAAEAALAERNNLAAQNAQLWRLIEKQRTGYAQIMKELDRVRAERDAARAKLDREKRDAKEGRVPLVRHLSEEPSTPRNTPPPNSRSHSSDQVSPVASRQPSRAMSNDSHLQPHHSSQSPSHPPHPQNTNLSQSHPPTVQGPARLDSLPQSNFPPQEGTRPLHLTPRKTSNASTTSEASHNRDAPSASAGPQPVVVLPGGLTVPGSSFPGSSSPSAPNNIVPGSSLAPAYPGPPMHSNSQPQLPQSQGGNAQGAYPALTSHSQPQLQHLPQGSFSGPDGQQLTVQQMHNLARDSRISGIPDEAKRFIMSGGWNNESPLPSPSLPGQPLSASDSSSHHGSSSPATSNAHLTSASSVTSGGAAASGLGYGGPMEEYMTGKANGVAHGEPVPRPSREEFLDMDESEGGHDDEDGRSSHSGQRQPNGDDLHQSQGRKPRAAAEDFPLPPSHSHPLPQVQGQNAAHAELQAQVQAQAQAVAQAQAELARAEAQAQAQAQRMAAQQRQDSPPEGDIPRGPQITQISDAPFPSGGGAGSFRALPLLPHDLPHTRISVAQSSIKANERGKEVLSFVVNVSPGSGKEGWRVEKLYSDVLGLDARVRASVGKGVGKKIASLPEGRLWRDHAPAKVDQRKAALENYLQTLIHLPVKNKDEVIAFFTSDIMREAKQPVVQAGYKEGYLTKRGKNFGGWKTRYFVLQGPVLNYYESRGGANLGSIQITGAQIGRQQRSGDRRESDEEKEYRHAFLIIEAKRGGSSSARHVLCAESDADRDSWVDVLVRYVHGSYTEDPNQAQPRASTSSNASSQRTPRAAEAPVIAKGPAVPISQLVPDAGNAKLFHSGTSAEDVRSTSPTRSMEPSPVDRHGAAGISDGQTARRMLDRGQAQAGQPSSVQSDSPLSSAPPFDSGLEVSGAAHQRSHSEMTHYPDLQEPPRHRHQSPEQRRTREPTTERRTLQPGDPSPTHDRPMTPDRGNPNSKVQISRPLNGAPIPAGYNFGGAQQPPPEPAATPNDRREKAKSRGFWGFGKQAAPTEKVPLYAPRAVFGVPLEEALDVAQIANLPAIVFRCIQYLEVKKADQEEGIYRLSGSSAVIKNLKDRFNQEGDVDLVQSDEYWDPHAIAGLLKGFLRELPSSILTRELHLRFLAVIDFVNPQERIAELTQLIAALPIANYSLLRALTAHLILIVQNSSVNKMTMRNVGIVFSPTLGIPAGVFSLMLGEFNRVFNVDGDDSDSDTNSQDEEAAQAAAAAAQPEQQQPSSMSHRNSRQYSDAAADTLLGLSGRSLLQAPAEEGPSDDGDGDDFSVDESTEATTENDASEQSSPGPGSVSVHGEGADATPPAPRSKASHVAMARGLNIATGDRNKRHSRMMLAGPGLPASPRPMQTPQTGATTTEALHTPR